MKMINFFIRKIIYFIILILFIIFCYLYILNIIINKKFNKNEYINYSPEIFSEIIYFNINNYYNINEIIKILLLSKYRLKNIINKPGDFFVKKNNIDIFKRSFNFPDTYENKIYIRMIFDENKLIKILDIKNNKYINFIRIEPQLISFPSYKNKYKLFLNKKFFPKTLIDILILIEDKKYYYHSGINFFSIIRAIIKNIKYKRIVQGGSTITQQLLKNIFFNNKKSFIRKFNEMLMSLIIDLKYSKDKILELYLNEIFFGVFNGKEIYGFPLASLIYFNTPVDELDLNQQIILISMVKGASLYNPYKNINLLKSRRDFIFEKIKLNNIIDSNLYDFLIKQPIITNKKSDIEFCPSFINIIKNEIGRNKFENCKKIFSTLNLNSQKSLHISSKIILKNLRKIKKISDLEVSILVVNYISGEIKSSIGGFNHQYDGFNRIYSRRQVGSIIKPIIYLYALNIPDKYKLNTFLLDKPIYYKHNKLYWSPKNSNNFYYGQVKLFDSFINSLNIPIINLGLNLGIDNIINFIKKSIDNINLVIKKYPSILLGAINLNLIEISQMYQSIANYGNLINVHSYKKTLDNKNVIFTNKKFKKKIFSSESSYLVLYCMQNVIKKGTALNISDNIKKMNIAGKTGTTNNCRDSWFVGIDNKELCVIWIGRDNNLSSNLTGSSGAMKIYQEYYNHVFCNPLIIKKPNDIHFLFLDKFGNVICDNHNSKFKIPIWTKDHELLKNSCPYHYSFIKIIKKFFKYII